LASASVRSTSAAAAHGLQGLQADATLVAHGLQAFFAAQGLHALALTTLPPQGLHFFFVAQGLHAAAS